MGDVRRMWKGAYALSLPDMVAVVMWVIERWDGSEVFRQRAVGRWYTVSSQSLGEKWAGVAGQERGTRVAAAQSPKAKAQLNGHKSCLVVSTSRARNSRVAEAELSPNNNNTAAREQLAREPVPLPNASSSILKIFHTIFPQFTKHPPLYAPTAVIPPAQIKTHRRRSYHRQNGRQKIRTRPAEGGR